MMSDGLSMLYRDISPLSLAALEDTGWFLVDYSIVATSPLGLGAGCDFLFDDCLQDNAVIAPSGDQIFCNYENLAGCAPDLKSISFCSLRNLTYLLDETIPDEYDYFGNNVSISNESVSVSNVEKSLKQFK
jgi:Leishmanolysin